MIIKPYLFPLILCCLTLFLTTNSSANEFVAHENGTVTDTTIGITWVMKDDNMLRDWNSAREYCRDLVYAGHDDWRLPDNYELQTIQLKGKIYPNINQDLFPATKPDRYWSGTELPYYDSMAFFVQFGPLPASLDKKQQLEAMQMRNKYYVRCIRGTRKKP